MKHRKPRATSPRISKTAAGMIFAKKLKKESKNAAFARYKKDKAYQDRVDAAVVWNIVSHPQLSTNVKD